MLQSREIAGISPAADPDLLPGLSGADRAALINAGRKRVYSPREYVCRTGESGTFAAMIVQGTVKILVNSAGGPETLLGLCGEGELVGELAAMRGAGAARDASVIAVDRVTCCLVEASRFRYLLDGRPGLRDAVMGQLHTRMRLSAASKLHSVAYPVAGRIALILVDLERRYGQRCPAGSRIGLALSQEALGQLVGACRESVVRSLADLRRRQVIHTGRRTIVVRDPPALRAYARTIIDRGTGPEPGGVPSRTRPAARP